MDSTEATENSASIVVQSRPFIGRPPQLTQVSRHRLGGFIHVKLPSSAIARPIARRCREAESGRTVSFDNDHFEPISEGGDVSSRYNQSLGSRNRNRMTITAVVSLVLFKNLPMISLQVLSAPSPSSSCPTLQLVLAMRTHLPQFQPYYGVDSVFIFHHFFPRLFKVTNHVSARS